MIYLAISAIVILIAYPLTGLALSVWLLFASQLILLIREVRTKQVTGVGAFIFMSILFFGIRPLHLLIEGDTKLFSQLFLFRFDTTILTNSMWWATLALWVFAVGANLVPRFHKRLFKRRRVKSLQCQAHYRPQQGAGFSLLIFQVLCLFVMVGLALIGKSIYRSGGGAYVYDLPIVLQAVQVFAVVTLFCRYIDMKNFGSLMTLCISGVLLLLVSLLMRNVTNFRSFYLSGLVATLIAIMQKVNSRWGYAVLLLPILVLQPAFRYLGETRRIGNEELDVNALVEAALPSKNLAQAYWDFYNYDGDMNIFDTFTAAKKSEPHFKPYLWSWLYVPLHFVPRAIWKGKPEYGTTMDLSFARGAPYSPGIAGFFLRDGGLLWMLLCMGILGYLISLADWFVMSMPRSNLQYCLIGILAVNGMLLSRVFLWQYFYQVLYMAVPCVVLNLWLKWGRRMSQTRKVQRKMCPNSMGNRMPSAIR